MTLLSKLRRFINLDNDKEVIKSDKSIINDDKVIITPDNDKTELILNKLEGLNLALKVHDNRLSEHDLKTDEYYKKLAADTTELLVNRKLITEDKKNEVKELIEVGLRSNKPRQEVIKDLMDNGISQATAYRYTRNYVIKGDNVRIIPDNDKTEVL